MFICHFNIIFCEVFIEVFTHFPIGSSIFIIDLWKFLIYSGYEFFVRYMIANIYLSAYGLLFHSISFLILMQYNFLILFLSSS